ncbi:SpoIIE family protein phosphatase [Streptomyces sp. A1136]|uniref:SpoIIE family protein phosphatase n=1 Tax=Streptomyces sp. A1136 TaxID=2563102 RepID=UPI00109EBD17|nr:hypothetical protein E6R62_25790 [Streptomyces sp. A1136]
MRPAPRPAPPSGRPLPTGGARARHQWRLPALDPDRRRHRRGRHGRRPGPQRECRRPHVPGPHNRPRRRRRTPEEGPRTRRFTSCVYAHIDLAGHTVRLASAGHPPRCRAMPPARQRS